MHQCYVQWLAYTKTNLWGKKRQKSTHTFPKASSGESQTFLLLPKGTFPARQHHEGLITNPSSVTRQQVEMAAAGRCKLK